MHRAMTLFSFHPGEFGEVYRGTLRIPSQNCKTVAIKTLKDTSPDGQWWNFLREATILGQFNHPHILHLEGVITKSMRIGLQEHGTGEWGWGWDHQAWREDVLLRRTGSLGLGRGVRRAHVCFVSQENPS